MPEGLTGILARRAIEARQNVVQGRTDATLWADVLEASGKLRRLRDSGAKELPTWPELLQDLFAAYYKVEPELRPEEDVDPTYRANRPLVAATLEAPQTSEARLVTRLDEMSSALATLAAGERLLEEIRSRPELRDAMAQAGAAGVHLGGDQEDAGSGAGDGQPGGYDQVVSALAAAAGQVRQAVRAAARAGAKEAEDVRQVLAGWGLEPGQIRRVPLGERLKLVERLRTPELRRLADLAGRLRNLARARHKERLRVEPDEIHSVSAGDDLARILPAELVALSHPLRRLDFYRRMQERRLLQYELRPRPRDGRGPVIVLIDASGSMSGTRMEWAAATALALLDLAHRQRRDFAAAYFRGPGAPVEAFRFPRGDVDPRDLLAFATVGADGGTDFQGPLSWALEVLGESRFRRGDVVLVTDGECALPEAFRARILEEKARRGFRIFTVLMAGRGDEVGIWSDRVWRVSRLDETTAGEIFEQI